MNMMNNEYVVINKTELLKRIEKLEKRSQLGLTDEEWNNERGQENALKEVLSQSTPFIPEIEKAFDAGRTVKNYKGEWQETYSDVMTSAKYKESKDYISNLKLDI